MQSEAGPAAGVGNHRRSGDTNRLPPQPRWARLAGAAGAASHPRQGGAAEQPAARAGDAHGAGGPGVVCGQQVLHCDSQPAQHTPVVHEQQPAVRGVCAAPAPPLHKVGQQNWHASSRIPSAATAAPQVQVRLRELEGENGSLRQELERLDAQNNNLQVGGRESGSGKGARMRGRCSATGPGPHAQKYIWLTSQPPPGLQLDYYPPS